MIKAGQRLQAERERKKLTLEEVSHHTKIRMSFLSAIEKGEYNKLPSVAYAQGFIRNYTIFLGLPEREILALFRREFDEEKHIKVLPESMTKDEEYIPSSLRVRQTAIWIGLIFLGLITFIVYQYRFAIFNPELYIASPKNNFISYSTRVVVTGKTDPNATVSVNNFSVSLNSNGEFRKVLNLFPGKSILTVKATNKYGKQTIEKRVVEVKLAQ
ncbi:helix-turn-helix domain-containing protein [Patescibacteria group bacterium]|nr:helix-turn-helix domain-containing protein [Patescibacteria group bacterium]